MVKKVNKNTFKVSSVEKIYDEELLEHLIESCAQVIKKELVKKESNDPL
ncbi:hypothetical protein [Halalkalibacter akibai]|nr:hypothetical protein [Halalkalibacter akibai]